LCLVAASAQKLDSVSELTEREDADVHLAGGDRPVPAVDGWVRLGLTEL